MDKIRIDIPDDDILERLVSRGYEVDGRSFIIDLEEFAEVLDEIFCEEEDEIDEV